MTETKILKIDARWSIQYEGTTMKKFIVCGQEYRLTQLTVTSGLMQAMFMLLCERETNQMPEAVRHSFNGYDWIYADNGNGSDWLERAMSYPDAEPLYTGEK